MNTEKETLSPSNNALVTEQDSGPSEPTINQVLVDKLRAETDAFVKELENKVYAVKVENENVLSALTIFIEQEVTWKNMEALGIIEVSKALRGEAGNIKNGNIFIKDLVIQAISFFLSKVEKTGLNNAEAHIKFIKPINDALNLIKQDNDKINRLQGELAAAENGISIEPTKSEQE